MIPYFPFTSLCQIIGMLIVSLFNHINCMDSFASTGINLASCNLYLKCDHNNPGDLMDSGLGRTACESSKSRLASSDQDLNTAATKIAKFDLNKIPENMASSLDNFQVEKPNNLSSERESLQALKRQRLIQAATRQIPKAFDPSTMSFYSNHQEINFNQVTNELETNFYQSSAAQKSQNSNQHMKLEILKAPRVYSSAAISTVRKFYPTDIRQRNDKFEGFAKHSPQPMTEPYADSKNKRKLISVDIKEAMDDTKTELSSLKVIKEHLSTEIEQSGTFDLMRERIYPSPYNEELLKFLEENLSRIVHESMRNYEIDIKFFEKFKVALWNVNQKLICTTEERALSAINLLIDRSHDHTGLSWIKSKSINFNLNPSIYIFRDVFSKFITYENMSRFFFSEKMRRNCIENFVALETRLLNSTNKNEISRRTFNNFFKRSWAGLTAYLAYVHAITAIVPPNSLLPLTNSKLVKNQEEALDFFFELHEDSEKIFRKRTEVKPKIKISDKDWKHLNFEKKRHLALDKILNTEVKKDQMVWLYVELWMIKNRLKLYKIATGKSNGGNLGGSNKFKCFINQVCFLLFSGFVKYQNDIGSKTSIKPMIFLHQ
ncbi:hypothetical protein BY996DRAFT_6909562 [Phakopsora pachyrhizi]|nr:hypothetical protein BY996DRAFT_6909562 [Phakopsora pachyrhizi]